jgi:hypothetical protein
MSAHGRSEALIPKREAQGSPMSAPGRLKRESFAHSEKVVQ